jgi:DNA uptake protein ComE-like DNA-binding protein
MKEAFREFLTFTSLERKGIVVLIILVVIITAINYYLSHDYPPTEPADSVLFGKELRAFEQQLTLAVNSNRYQDSFPDNPAIAGEMFPFDPNDVTETDLLRLGLNKGSARALVRYRIQGGKFYRKEDLKKIYGISSPLYHSLAPFIRIKPAYHHHAEAADNAPGDSRSVNINLADTAELEELPGIGKVLARRIVGYRKLLGGYYETGQLREVYGISDSLYQRIRNQVYADTSLIIKINLNLAGENELAHHPYIGKYMAKGIISYRSHVQAIQSFQELILNGLIKTGDMKRLKIYLLI